MNFNEGCTLCPRKCRIKRSEYTRGFCGAYSKIKAARASLHMWEEPCISGTRGSGTIFFTGCPLSCVFCQNREISQNDIGKFISTARLCEIFFELKDIGAHNINLVSPTPYIPHIAEAIDMAKKRGFDLPFVFNSSGFEEADSLKMLDGLIDIYLPDFKYKDSYIANKYSGTPDYFTKTCLAADEMVRQTGDCRFDNDGMMTHGIIFRHLVLPANIDDSKEVIRYLYERYKDSIYISIMSQYTPLNLPSGYGEIDRKLSEKEYDDVVNFACSLGITNGFIQDGEAASESFIPMFDCRGI